MWRSLIFEFRLDNSTRDIQHAAGVCCYEPSRVYFLGGFDLIFKHSARNFWKFYAKRSTEPTTAITVGQLFAVFRYVVEGTGGAFGFLPTHGAGDKNHDRRFSREVWSRIPSSQFGTGIGTARSPARRFVPLFHAPMGSPGNKVGKTHLSIQPHEPEGAIIGMSPSSRCNWVSRVFLASPLNPLLK